MTQRSRVKLLSSAWHLAALVAVISSCDEQPLTGPAPTASLIDDLVVIGAARGLGGPLPLLTADERRRFARGSIVFQTVFTPATGSGPLFNSISCAECHEAPVVGGSGDEVETHATALQGGVCDDLAAVGGPVIQDSMAPALQAALGIEKEPVPLEATATGHRTTPSILGFGLLEAVPDDVLLSRADPHDRDGDGISGRPNRSADGRIGRFGRKAQAPTLREFNGDAFAFEMGITNPQEPDEPTVRGEPLPPGIDLAADPELSEDDLDATDTFVRLLAPPPPLQFTRGAEAGRRLFTRIGCAGCHVPTLRTGPNPVRALSNRVVHAYTDLLLHDMGPDLADICLGLAEPSEFRTEPLMGLRFKETFLHDGRAATLRQAIRLHAGEAARARDRFLALSPGERFLLLRFLRAL